MNQNLDRSICGDRERSDLFYVMKHTYLPYPFMSLLRRSSDTPMNERFHFSEALRIGRLKPGLPTMKPSRPLLSGNPKLTTRGIPFARRTTASKLGRLAFAQEIRLQSPGTV